MRKNYIKGEVVDLDLGKPGQGIKGHEQGFARPCLVVKGFDALGLLVVIPLTSKVPGSFHYATVKILKGSGGLDQTSYALCHQIRTVSVERILKRAGYLPILMSSKSRRYCWTYLKFRNAIPLEQVTKEAGNDCFRPFLLNEIWCRHAGHGWISKYYSGRLKVRRTVS